MRPGPEPRRRERSFQHCYRRHVGDVYHYALGVLRDPVDAEEVTNTVFLNAYRAFRRDSLPAPHLNDLLTLAHEVCRLRGGHPRLIEADFFVVEEVTTATDVRRALGRLPFDQRAVLVMREVEGRSYGEIAQILALPVASVETLIFRARHELRKYLEGALTCHEAELAISRELDDRLSWRERRPLRAHLRSCEECRAFARCQQIQREAIRALATIPLPETLQWRFGARLVLSRRRRARRFAALAGTTALVVVLLSSGGVPQPTEDRKLSRPAASH